MEFKSTSVILFEVDSEEKIEIPEIVNPAYIFKVGDKFKFFDVVASSVKEFEVTDVKYEIENFGVCSDVRIVTYVTDKLNKDND